MAWSHIGKKGIYSNVAKVLVSSSQICGMPLSMGKLATYGRVDASTVGIICYKVVERRSFHATHGSFGKHKKFESSNAIITRKRANYPMKKSNKGSPVEAKNIPSKPRVQKYSRDRTVEIFEGISLVELSRKTGETVEYLQQVLVNVRENVVSEFEPMCIDVAELVAMELGINVRRMHCNDDVKLQSRSPVVTVMGHVDHGKTSLLDALRETSVAAREAGGITQHLGAFVVSMPSGASITFLDTPGHAAFSAMRARGAAVTDIVVLVVAADDGVMPQTRESISLAKEANVPIVVAINKCDKPSADPQRVKTQLCSEGLMLEEIGGDIQVLEISATKKIGLENLEEALLLQAELMDLKARVDGPARAYVVEAKLDRGRGPLATSILNSGTLVCGLYLVVGAEWGRIRALRDMTGKAMDHVQPGMPVEIEGLKGLPMAGDDVIVVDTEERAKMLSTGRKRKLKADRMKMISSKKLEMHDTEEEAVEHVEMPIIIKADVQGAVQAVRDALNSLNSPQVFINIIHVGVGPVSRSDVDLAHACGACIVGFNIRNPQSSISMEANRRNIKVCIHSVIYHLLEEMGNLIVERAPGNLVTQVAGEGQILDVFEVLGRSKTKEPEYRIAGCRVTDGHFAKSSTMRILRSGEVIFEGSCLSLKREKHDVEAVAKGNECGIVIKDYNDFRIGDTIHCLEQVNVKPKFVALESGAVQIQCD